MTKSYKAGAGVLGVIAFAAGIYFGLDLGTDVVKHEQVMFSFKTEDSARACIAEIDRSRGFPSPGAQTACEPVMKIAEVDGKQDTTWLVPVTSDTRDLRGKGKITAEPMLIKWEEEIEED